ncbi:MAG: peptidase P60, partial [Methyloligellaceae bacterium]
MEEKLDARLNAYRRDIAAQSLRGLVDAEKYATGEARQIISAAAPVRREPRSNAPLDTEALYGERVTIYDESNGWAWGQLEGDRYVGYLPSECLSSELVEVTHKIAALRTFVYPAADIKAPPLFSVSFGACVKCTEVSNGFAEIGTGRFIFARHIIPVESRESDYVAVGERFVGTP